MPDSGHEPRLTWMPLDFGEFRSEVAHLSDSEKIAYLDLLAFYWEYGWLPKESDRLANIVHMPVDTWSNTHVALSMHFFEDSDGRLHLVSAREKREKWIGKRLKARQKAIKAINARWSKYKAKQRSQGSSTSDTPSIPQVVPEKFLEQVSVLNTKANTTTSPLHPPLPGGQKILGVSALETTGGETDQGAGELADTPSTPSIGDGMHESVNLAKQGISAPRAPAEAGDGGNLQAAHGDSVAVAKRGSAGRFNSDADRLDAPTLEKEFSSEILKFMAAGEVEGFEFTLSALDLRGLGRFIRENPKVDLARFKQLLRNRAASEGVNRAEPPRKWVRGLIKYADGPLDAFDKPMKRPRVH